MSMSMSSSSSSTPPSRYRRLNSKPKEPPKRGPPPTTATTSSSSSPEQTTPKKSLPRGGGTLLKNNNNDNNKLFPTRRRRSLARGPKSEEQVVGLQKGRDNANADTSMLPRSSSLNRPLLEQFAPRPSGHHLDSSGSSSGGGSSSRNEEDCNNQLLEKLQVIKNLEAQVSDLSAELDRARCFNEELQSHNNKLQQDLAAALLLIKTTSPPPPQEEPVVGEREETPQRFKDIQKLIASKLEHPKDNPIKNPQITTLETSACPPSHHHPMSKAHVAEIKAPSPPPPPPPPLRPLSKAPNAPKAPAILEFYHSLRKHEEKGHIPAPPGKPPAITSTAHSSIVGEIENRSAHLLAIRADIQTKADFINGLIQKVVAAAYTDIEHVVQFVDWLDAQLSCLMAVANQMADERAVLRHFNWPERKADALREAAIEYRGLKLLQSEISSYKDDTSIPCGDAMKKMAVLLDKSERGIERLIKLRNSVMRSYQDWKIPTDWMLDPGIGSKIKKASMKLAKMYMERVMAELETARNSERESNQEALLLQGVHFAYRTHQFAGGLDSETLCAFEEMRRCVPGRLGERRESSAAIPSS